jgi:hypothetical protein
MYYYGYMKNTKNGYIGIVLTVLITAVAIGAGIYTYKNKSISEVSMLQNESKENFNQTEGELTEGKAPSSKNNSSPISTTTNKNCGSILDKHLLAESEKRTYEETKSLGCISGAILSCSPANLTVTGDYNGKFQIFSKTGKIVLSVRL